MRAVRERARVQSARDSIVEPRGGLLRPFDRSIDREVDTPDVPRPHHDLPGDASGNGLAVAGGDGRDVEVVPGSRRDRDEEQRYQEDETELDSLPAMLHE